ncbi:MAG: YbaB/EbfC family nucleoid-associated protein [Chloroflexi bacterium]|nr:YbaB/EbfC family nucleoid-associated protein [Chloroflexota bacterium]
MNREMLRQAQQLQAKLAKVQAELENMVVEASAGGGAVKVAMTGQQRVSWVKISPEAVDPQEVELLEDLVMAAMNEALDKVQGEVSRRLGPLTGGLGLPGMKK